MSSKKILIALGSPRKNGNSSLLAKKAAEGIETAGSSYELLYLHDLHIQPCTACEWCRSNKGQFCVLKDDMASIYPKMKEADGLIIASPVYWFTVSAQTKLFMDRWYGFVDKGGYLFKEMSAGIILTFGDSDPFNSGAVNALRTFQDAFNYLNIPVIDMVYGSAYEPGKITANQEIMDKAFALGMKIAQP